MNECASIQTLPGSRIHYRETDEELVFALPWRTVRGVIGAILLGGAFLLCVGFLGFWTYQVGWWSLLVLVPFAIFVLLFFGIFFALFARAYLATTLVYITRERLVLKTIVLRRQEVETFSLNESSYARQYWETARQQRRDPAKRPSAIEITSDENSSENPAAVFGHALSRGELDWVEWRINRFLGRATDADAPAGMSARREAAAAVIEGLPDEPLAAPEDTKIRIEEGVFETRIHFPGTVAMGSYKGIGTAVVGLGISGWAFIFIVGHWRGLSLANPSWIVGGVVGLFGLLLLFAGLTRLCGRSVLTVSPERIMLRTALLGIVPFYWKTLPTADVISVGSTKTPRSRTGRVTGPSKGHVIRTATKEIRYGDQLWDAVRNEAEANWLAGEIALRIQAARSGESLSPVRHRRRQRPLKAVETARKRPKGPVPYHLHQRPMPSGNNLDALLPVQVGPFQRETFEQPDCAVNDSYEVEYRSDQGQISLTFSVCANSVSAQKGVAVAQAEVTAHEVRPDQRFSLDTEPSFFLTAAPGGAFIAWSRGNYFFSASVRDKSSEQVLDRFMKAFPY